MLNLNKQIYNFSKCFSFLILIIPITSLSQIRVEDKNEIIESRVEYLVENIEESIIDYTTIFHHLNNYYNHPLDINKADFTALKELSLLTDIQINYLLDHIEKTGRLINKEELQAIEGFDITTIRLILPFIKITTNTVVNFSLNEIITKGKNQLIIRYQDVLEQRKGFSSINDNELLENPNSRYIGSSAKIYARYRYTYRNRLSIGITGEKDAGEQFFKGSQKSGFDFYSGHIFLKNQGRIKQLAMGDYQAQFGQGLTYWSGFSFGKSANITSIKRYGKGLIPYTSVDENRFMRGGGITFQAYNVEATLFYSKNTIDGNLVNNTAKKNRIITSIQQTGFHRTKNELEDKDAISQQLLGGHLAYKLRKLNVGITSVLSKLNRIYSPLLQVHNQFRKSKNKQINYGIDYNWVYRNFNLFGEYAKSLYSGSAIVTGALIALDPKLSVSILYRNYQRNFKPIASSGLGESSITENEKGIYLGMTLQPKKRIKIDAYYDRFSFPWLKFGVNSPSKGDQYLTQVTYTFSKKTNMYFRIRYRNKEKNASLNIDGIDYLVNEKIINYRYQISHYISKTILLKSRIELVKYHKEESPYENGFLIFQDIIYQPKKFPLSFSYRYALIDTDSYNSRVYAYENDIQYVYSVPAYFNKGVRTYFTLRCKIKKGLTVWLRYALTYFENVDTIGSDLEEINGNHKQDVKAQIRFKF